MCIIIDVSWKVKKINCHPVIFKKCKKSWFSFIMMLSLFGRFVIGLFPSLIKWLTNFYVYIKFDIFAVLRFNSFPTMRRNIFERNFNVIWTYIVNHHSPDVFFLRPYMLRFRFHTPTFEWSKPHVWPR